MAITYQWVISQMDCVPQEGNLQDVVVTVHYRYQGTEVDADKTYFAEVYGTVTLGNPDPEHYTPYADLTKTQVEDWLTASLNVESLQANISTQIANQKNPPIITPNLPWSTN